MERLMEKELRKRQSHLTQTGTGVMLFAAWRVISVNLYLGFGTLPLEMIQQEAAQVSLELGVNEKFFLVFMLFFRFTATGKYAILYTRAYLLI